MLVCDANHGRAPCQPLLRGDGPANAPRRRRPAADHKIGSKAYGQPVVWAAGRVTVAPRTADEIPLTPTVRRSEAGSHHTHQRSTGGAEGADLTMSDIELNADGPVRTISLNAPE